MVRILLLLVFSLACLQGWAQINEEALFSIDTPLTIDMDEQEDNYVQPKKKKVKKKVFYGVKTKKRFTKKGIGENTVFELFRVLKVHEEPDPYVRDIYWLDTRRNVIRVGGKVDPKFGKILHGPYQKRQGELILEEGLFFKGTKHGRWMNWDKNEILQDKVKYFKGWPKESLVSYYDDDRTKLKEIVPIVHGKKEGYYFYFYENGNIAMSGEFQSDRKVGRWSEYYPTRNRRKKVIQYPNDPYDTFNKPFVWKEWNEKSEEVYDYVPPLAQKGS
jgi:hypothetical protein